MRKIKDFIKFIYESNNDITKFEYEICKIIDEYKDINNYEKSKNIPNSSSKLSNNYIKHTIKEDSIINDVRTFFYDILNHYNSTSNLSTEKLNLYKTLEKLYYKYRNILSTMDMEHIIMSYKIYDKNINNGLVLTKKNLGLSKFETITDLNYDLKLLYTSDVDPQSINFGGTQIGQWQYKIWLTPDYNFIVAKDNEIIDLDSMIRSMKRYYKMNFNPDHHDEKGNQKNQFGSTMYSGEIKIITDRIKIILEVKNKLNDYIKKAKNGELKIEMNANKFNL